MANGNAPVSAILLHLPYQPETGRFVGEIQSIVSQQADPRLKERWGATLGELSLAVTSKLAMLEVVERRVDIGLGWLLKTLQEDEARLQRSVDIGAAFPLSLPDQRHLFEILVDLDAFLFESRSAYEIVGKFVGEFWKHILGRTTGESEIKAMLAEGGIDIRWTEALRTHRKFFFHQSAPWLAVEVSTAYPEKLGLVVMTKNVEKYDEESCIRFQVFREIYSEFRHALAAIPGWLGAQLAEETRTVL